MTKFVPLLLALATMIWAAKTGGWLSTRLGQPATLGMLVVGLLLGPSGLNLLSWSYFADSHAEVLLWELGELGVILLMFSAGIEIDIGEMRRTGRPAVLAGLLGVVVPVVLGMSVALPFGYNPSQSIFLGLVLAATSVSISAQTLIELNLLRSREGMTLLGAAVVDDVLAIAFLSLFLALSAGAASSVMGVLWTVVRMMLFLGAAGLVGVFVLPRLIELARQLPVSEPVVSTAIVSTFLFAWAAEYLGGVAAITGAFVAGVGLSRSSARHEIERGLHTLNYTMLVPIFLVGIGLQANLRALSLSDVGVEAAICAVAIVSKWVGAGMGARLGGMSWREAIRVGAGMVSRGEVGLIIAGVGVAGGLITTAEFTLIVVMVLVTTLVTPPLLRLVFKGEEVTDA